MAIQEPDLHADLRKAKKIRLFKFMNTSGLYRGGSGRPVREASSNNRPLFINHRSLEAKRLVPPICRVPTRADPMDRITQRIRDMDISTSFVSECCSDTSSPTNATAIPKPSLPINRAPSFERSQPQAESVCKRQEVLEAIGEMLDANLISDEEASSSITLAMQANDTFDRMAVLLSSRRTLEGKSSFLRLWLRGMRCPEPSPSLDDSEIQRPLARSRSNCNLEIMPIPSPPLLPVSLNFADEVDERRRFKGLVKLVRHSQSISTPSTGMSPSPELSMGRLASQSSDDLN
jgi:hypothetical protein